MRILKQRENTKILIRLGLNYKLFSICLFNFEKAINYFKCISQNSCVENSIPPPTVLRGSLRGDYTMGHHPPG
jgi:hypothetical protein